jgi:dolichyl-diphosphooligosaccharide--protein glycosyltransferase
MKHYIQKVKEKVSEHRTELLILAMVFLLAFGVRAYLMQYELPFEFDPYWHARMLSYLIVDGKVPEVDPIAYWHFSGGIQVDRTSPLFWYAGLAIYKVITFGSPIYSKDAVILVMKLAPALFGALAAIALFFLIKEIYGRKAGIAAGILAAVVPAFVYRTMSGFFEPTSMGFMWLTAGLYFIARAVNRTQNFKSGAISAVAGGVMLGLMALSWKGFMFIFPILMLVAFFTLLNVWIKKTRKEVINYIIFLVIVFALLIGFGWLVLQSALINVPLDIISTVFNTMLGGSAILLATGGIIGIIIIAVLLNAFFAKKGETWNAKSIGRYFKLVALFAIIAVMLYAITSGKEFGSSGVIGSSIGEESHGSNFFGNKYNLLFFISLVAFILIPIKDFKDNNDSTSVIVFSLAIITLFMAWTKLKFTFLFGLPLAATSGIIFWYGLEFFKQKNHKMIAGIALTFLLLVGIAAGTFFVSQQFPNIEQDDGWKPSLKWLSTNTPKDSKIFNWWDEGHWIGFVGERGPIIDNRNAEGGARTDVALFATTEDLNVAESIMKKYKPDYIMFGDDLLSKQTSLAQYAYNSFNDPRIKQTFGLALGCGKSTEPVSGTVTFDCGGNKLNEQQMNSLPTSWISQANNFLNERTPVFIYRTAENSRIYILDPNANSTVLAKLWFNDVSITGMGIKEVYSNKAVKIFKVSN